MSSNDEEDQGLYHATHPDNVEGILQRGLLADPDPFDVQATPWSGHFFKRGVHFAMGLEDARKWARQINNAYSEAETLASEREGRPDGMHDPHIAIFRVKDPSKLRDVRRQGTDIGVMEHVVPHDVPPDNLEHVETIYPHVQGFRDDDGAI